jgi:hypothetical protein
MHDPAFAKALLDEAAMLGRNGDRIAEQRLRDLVTASAPPLCAPEQLRRHPRRFESESADGFSVTG